jgi:prepilin-type N-terminal cleavage/methylation domain-containing protein
MKRLSSQRAQRGFTLAEILVTTAIFAVIMIAALAVYDQSNKVFKSSSESADLQQSTRIGFDKLVADLRMAGFDYSRGGTPTRTGEYQQPDEQIEYAGVSAIAFRGNFDYNTDSAHGNGLEYDEGYTPKTPQGKDIFPFVTTGNDEIVIYALRSVDTTKNTNSISFYADVSRPRKAYPGGAAETLVTVGPGTCASCGIDTTNANPPYTLYRMTVEDVLAGRPGTPVAENIRSLRFSYYTDANGATVLENAVAPVDITTGRNADGSTFSAHTTVNGLDVATGAIGGAGLYDPNLADVTTAANFVDRSQRYLITSVRVDLTGMSANIEPGFTQPGETVAAVKNYRQYQLRALVVPRNLGLTGFPEPSYTPPSPPTITGVCTGHCAAPVICWSAPTAGGPVVKYRIEWDTNSQGSFSNFLDIVDSSARTAIVPDDGAWDPTKQWFFHILAVNDNGASQASDPVLIQPINRTQPGPPTAFRATFATSPHSTTPANTDYAIGLTFKSATTNNPAVANSVCVGTCSMDARTIPIGETIHYRIYRGTTDTFDPHATPAQGVKVADFNGTPGGNPNTDLAWLDSPATSAFPPGTCVSYYYRIESVDRCALYPAGGNAAGSTSVSAITPDPAAGSAAQVIGKAFDAGSGIQAAKPGYLKVDTTVSNCPLAVNSLCTIALQWPAVTSDSAGSAIGVDKYRIKRQRKIITDTGYSDDTTFGTAGVFDKSGYSQLGTGLMTFTDTTAPALDSNGQPYYYQYTVTANDCRPGIESDPAKFPSLCTVNPVIVQAGASNYANGASGGDTPGTAWTFNYGDTIKVSPPDATFTITKVVFDVLAWPSLASVDSATVNGPITAANPAAYSWTDRSDNQIYYVKITVTSSTNCTEMHVKYVQDQQAAACAFTNRAGPVPSETTAGSTSTGSGTMTITNAGSDPIVFAGKPISITFIDPDGLHADIRLTQIVWSTGVFSSTDSVGSFNSNPPTALAPGTYTRSVPANMPNIAAGGTFSVTFRWQYAKRDAPIARTPLTKFCINYTIASEPGVTKKCNAVGQSGTTLNPTSCD